MLHRDRPGAEAIRAAEPGCPEQVADRIWASPGLSNSYLLAHDEGCVVVNAGMGFEGPVHRENYSLLDAGPVTHLVLTQGHVDHVGGTDALRQEGTVVVAHADWRTWRDDNARLMPFRARRAAFAWSDAITAALEHAAALPDGFPAQSVPTPDLEVREPTDLDAGGRRISLVPTRGGETTDSLLVHLRDEGVLLVGNALGALAGHVPNLATMRGDRYRDALEVVATIETIRGLGAETLLTGHFGPIRGAAYIDAELVRLRDAVLFVHDRTVEGMNAGRDVTDLMREVVLPPELEVGQGYGTVAWAVRAVWEGYAGWFHHRSTTELYAVRPDAAARELAALAGAEVVVEAAAEQLAAGDPVRAVALTDAVLADQAEHAGARAVARAAHEQLLARATNFWERAWLVRELERLS